MFRTTAILGALVMAATSASAGSYSGQPVSPASGRLITRDIVWNCGPAACQGSTQESRPAVLCQSLAKRTGTIQSFMVDGRAFSAAELQRCNAAAKPAPGQALEAQ